MNPEIIEHIERFLEGEIPREELRSLAEGLEIEDLEQEIAWVKDSQTAIEAAGLRAQWKEALSEVQKPKAKVRPMFSSRVILSIAAAIALLLVIYIGLQNQQTSPDLYAQYEYKDPGLPILMSQSEDYLLYDALTYFGEENYEVAAEKLQAIEDAYPQSDTLAYYLGASYLYVGKTDLAQPALQRVLEIEDSRFIQKAEWLLVLLALREEDEASASTRLSNILATPGHEFSEAASDLAKELAK